FAETAQDFALGRFAPGEIQVGNYYRNYGNRIEPSKGEVLRGLRESSDARPMITKAILEALRSRDAGQHAIAFDLLEAEPSVIDGEMLAALQSRSNDGTDPQASRELEAREKAIVRRATIAA